MAATRRAKNRTSGSQSDLLLWIAGGIVAAVAIAWLVVLRPWAGAPAPAVQAAPAATVAMAADAPQPPPNGNDAPSSTLDNPLRMADLAFQAGMLVEPQEYSAWTLYRSVLKNEPSNAAALEGLNKVADELVRRGETALEQGRFDDARANVERVRAALPQHPGMKALAVKIWPATGGHPVEVKPELPPPKIAPVQVEPPKPTVDPVAELAQKFDDAFVGGRLLTPAADSAKHYLEVLSTKHANNDATRNARDRLSHEFLGRATQSLDAHDLEAAGVWIDEADHVGADPVNVRAARAQLVDQQIALESAKPMPASALKIAAYVKPVYPQRALERGIEGWVDLEFTVQADGTTSSVTVAAASHENYFRREAVAAVEQWKFEPRVFMNRPIAQRSYTRIRFVQ